MMKMQRTEHIRVKQIFIIKLFRKEERMSKDANKWCNKINSKRIKWSICKAKMHGVSWKHS